MKLTMNLEAEFFFQQGLRRNKAEKYEAANTLLVFVLRALRCR